MSVTGTSAREVAARAAADAMSNTLVDSSATATEVMPVILAFSSDISPSRTASARGNAGRGVDAAEAM